MVEHTNTPLTYPQNLLQAVTYNSGLEPPTNYSKDILAGIQYVLSTLNYREQDIIRMRFEEKLTRSKIGESLGISQERVHQIEAKALRSMRTPARWNYLKLGVAGYMRWAKENARGEGYTVGYRKGYKDGNADGRNGIDQLEISEELLNYPLKSLGLSVRAYNCLHRTNCVCVGDVVRMTELQIKRIKNLGVKTAGEIAAALKTKGISNTNWDKYTEY